MGAWIGSNLVLTTMAMVMATMRCPGALTGLALGDRRGVFRDASNAIGHPTIACDTQPCESTQRGLFYHGDGDDFAQGPRFDRLATFAPCEQQTLSLGMDMSATKALDGRMWWGMAGWLLW